jgi:hypothetical protein
MGLVSHWDGGTRDYFRVIQLKDMKIVEVPQNGTMVDPIDPLKEIQLPSPGYLVVRHAIFQGKDMGLKAYIHPDNVNPELLPVNDEALSWREKVVLLSRRMYKNTYAGEKNICMRRAIAEAGISKETYLDTFVSLQERKMLSKIGALTNKGKNALSPYNLCGLHQLAVRY